MNFLAPLADRLRPRSLLDYFGQKEIMGEQKLLPELVSSFKKNPDFSFPSLVFWGPPGSGKTTLAKLLAIELDFHFEAFSAVSSGVKELRQLIEDAKYRREREQKRSLLFVDEIHRFNKAQQDVLLPAMEEGIVTLVGATTENPSFEINSALLSRAKVLALKPLEQEALFQIIQRALADTSLGLGSKNLKIEESAKQWLVDLSMGDARSLLNALELAAARCEKNGCITGEYVKEAFQRQHLKYDKNGEEHYDLISALHKSVRASDPQASLYYLARMIEAGEDPLYLVRRLTRIASEDIGLADPQALILAAATRSAVELMGYPECDVSLAQLTIYLATAPKSNRSYLAINEAREEIRRSGTLPIPLNLRNAPTKLMKEMGYAKGYIYDPDTGSGVSRQETLPEKLKGRQFYKAGAWGFEKEISKRIEYFEQQRKKDS